MASQETSASLRFLTVSLHCMPFVAAEWPPTDYESARLMTSSLISSVLLLRCLDHKARANHPVIPEHRRATDWPTNVPEWVILGKIRFFSINSAKNARCSETRLTGR